MKLIGRFDQFCKDFTRSWLVSFVFLGNFYCIRFCCIIIVLLVHILITLRITLPQTLNTFNGTVQLIFIRPFSRRKAILSRIILTKTALLVCIMNILALPWFLPYSKTLFMNVDKLLTLGIVITRIL